MVFGTLVRQRKKMFMIAFTVALGVSLATGMLNVMLGVGDKVNKELKTYGANINVVSKEASLISDLYELENSETISSDKYLKEEDLPKIKQIFWGFSIVDFTPYLEKTIKVNNQKTKFIGTWFEKHMDLSTGDAITPSAIEYKYRLMFEDRTILLKSYNIETILAEKLQTILSRGILNTRMRDFYDIHVLMSIYKDDIDKDIMKKSFFRTCSNRKTFYVMESGNLIIDKIAREKYLKNLWVLYQKKYEYAQPIDYETVMYSILVLFKIVEL